MFQCMACGRVQKPKVKPVVRVSMVRNVTYFRHTGEEAGRGYETVREVSLCQACAEDSVFAAAPVRHGAKEVTYPMPAPKRIIRRLPDPEDMEA